MSNPSVATSFLHPSAESLQQPILPIYIWTQVFDNFQALENLDDIVWLWTTARHVSVHFKRLIVSLFGRKYLPLVQIRVPASAQFIRRDLQYKDSRGLRTFHFDGMSSERGCAVFTLRPDCDPRRSPDNQPWCYDQADTIQRLTFERLRRFRPYHLLGLQIKIGDLVSEYTPPDLYLEEGIESFSFSWRDMFTKLLGEEKIAMTRYSRWLSHLNGDIISDEDVSNVGGLMELVENQAMLWTEDKLANPRPELARYLWKGVRRECQLIVRRSRCQRLFKDHSGMVDYNNLLGEQEWYRPSMPESSEDFSAMGDYHKTLSDHRWYRNPTQRTTGSPSNRPRHTPPSQGLWRLSRGTAVQGRQQHVQLSEATRPFDMDVDVAPDLTSLHRAVTPTKPSRSETLASPKAPNKLIRKFSEAHGDEYTPCPKHPRLSVYLGTAGSEPETADPEPETATHSLDALKAGIQQMRISSPLPTSNERTLIYNPKDFFNRKCIGRKDIASSFAAGEEEHHDDDGKNDIRHFEELSDPGTSSMEAASSLASEEEEADDYQDGLTYGSDNCIEVGTSLMESMTSFFYGGGEEEEEEEEENDKENMYPYNSQGTRAAELEQIETIPFGLEDEDMFTDDESLN